MPREAVSKRPPHPARLCLTAPAGPTSPAPSICRGGRGEGGARAEIESVGKHDWCFRIYAADGEQLAFQWKQTRRACKQRLDRLIAACVEIAEQRQRPGEIGGEIGGRFAAKPGGGQDGRKAIKSKEKAARHVAKVATARTGRN